METAQQPASDPEEREAQERLLQAGVLIRHSICPWCGNHQVKPIRREKIRCPVCRHEWGLRKDSILEGTRIPYSQFIKILHMFAEDIPVNRAASQAGIAYNTVNEMYRRFRIVLVHNSWNRPKEGRQDNSPDHSVTYPIDPEKWTVLQKNLHVFGIRRKKDLIFIEPVRNPDPALIPFLPVPKIRRGHLLLIEGFGNKYQGFIAYISKETERNCPVTLILAELPWSPLADFWAFAVNKWMNHKGLSQETFPEFVHELAFRYNHRTSDLFITLLARIGRKPQGTVEKKENRHFHNDHPLS